MKQFSVVVLSAALTVCSLAHAQSRPAAVPVDPALAKQIRDSIEQGRAEGDLSRVKRDLSRLLEVYPNDPIVRAPIYFALAQASTKLGDDAMAVKYRAEALAIDPHIEAATAAQNTAGASRGGDDKLSTILSMATMIMTQVQQARQAKAAAALLQPNAQALPQANAFPAAPVGLPGAPAPQPGMPAPGGFPGGVVVGYDANNQPIYAQQQAPAPVQPAPNMAPPPAQYPAPAPQQAYYPPNQPAPQQAQAQPYPPASGYPAQAAYPVQPGYPAQAGYPPQQGYPAQSAYPPQQGYPAQQGAPYGYPPNPYGAPANYSRRRTRSEQAPPIKVFYDRSRLGDANYFQDPCAALLDVDSEGTLTITPGCGEASLIVPASEIVDVRMNVAVAKQVGAFHIETAKGLYLTCSGQSGTRDESLEMIRSLRQKLNLSE